MLILMRRPGERVMIGDHVIFTVMEIEGNRVSVGIEAPKDVPVHREEVYDAIQREQQGLPPIACRRKTG